jgi:hypothetical protein
LYRCGGGGDHAHSHTASFLVKASRSSNIAHQPKQLNKKYFFDAYGCR